MGRSPWASLFLRLTAIHAPDDAGEDCAKCQEPIPCDTMRAVWIYDLENGRQII